MCLLAKSEILKEMKKGNIKITPLNRKNIGPGSVDLTLDNMFRKFLKSKKVNINENTDYKKLTKKIKSKSITLLPGELVLGITKERIKLAPNLAG